MNEALKGDYYYIISDAILQTYQLYSLTNYILQEIENLIVFAKLEQPHASIINESDVLKSLQMLNSKFPGRSTFKISQYHSNHTVNDIWTRIEWCDFQNCQFHIHIRFICIIYIQYQFRQAKRSLKNIPNTLYLLISSNHNAVETEIWTKLKSIQLFCYESPIVDQSSMDICEDLIKKQIVVNSFIYR